MYKAIWACCALALLTTPAMAQPAPLASESARFQAQDLFGLEVASDPQISPDGSRIAYVRQTADIMTDRMRPTIWLIDARTGQQTPLVATAGAHSQPRWSPDGTRIAYISTAEGGGAQLFVRWVASGQSVRVTNLPNTPTGISWLPDGARSPIRFWSPASAEAGLAPDQARRRPMGPAAGGHRHRHLPRRRPGLSEAWLSPGLRRPRRRRRRAPTDPGRLQPWRRPVLVPRFRHPLSQRQSRRGLAA